ncbi:MAG: hypothetical protein JXR48_02640 [Candidatus Delongbacteria bacterium]|nr:hypothetical protein [Candidatus Delongbacteria bacterium]
MNQKEEAKNKTDELLEDQNFINSLEQAKTDENIIALFAEKNVDVTREDLFEAKKELLKNKNAELQEDDLELVQGGGIILMAGILAVGVIITTILAATSARKSRRRK